MLKDSERLTVHDYTFLKGDTAYWPQSGAAYAVTQSWCKNMGYGIFGKPTGRGLKAIADYDDRFESEQQ